MEVNDTRSQAQRWSDNIALFCGSWGFIFWSLVIIAVWMLLNGTVFHFDIYPYILLNLMLTVVSTMQSPVIMMAQNRQEERDRQRVEDAHEKMDKLQASIDG